MTFIYSFLQKRKMHENQHGIIMVVIAYALSILLLTLGSDVFYDIKSTAAGISADTEEETQDTVLLNTSDARNVELSKMIQADLINPYNIKDLPEIDLSNSNPENNVSGSETIWLLGNAMNNETFDKLMAQADSLSPKIVSAESSKKAEDEQSESAKEDNNSIKSFSVEVGAEGTVITITEEDVSMLERIVEAEAGGEDMEGKILIANVIFNRIADEEFPDTVEEVIFQKSHGDYQFSPVDSGRYWSVDISDKTKEAVQRVLDGEDYSKGALYFIARKRTTSESAKWFDNNLTWLFKHGGHEFYK